MNVFKNVHELLTDPKSGLEQLYASVKNANGVVNPEQDTLP